MYQIWSIIENRKSLSYWDQIFSWILIIISFRSISMYDGFDVNEVFNLFRFNFSLLNIKWRESRTRMICIRCFSIRWREYSSKKNWIQIDSYEIEIIVVVDMKKMQTFRSWSRATCVAERLFKRRYLETQCLAESTNFTVILLRKIRKTSFLLNRT